MTLMYSSLSFSISIVSESDQVRLFSAARLSSSRPWQSVRNRDFSRNRSVPRIIFKLLFLHPNISI